MAKQFVRDLEEKQSVQSVFLVRDKMLSVGKTGRPYMSLMLSDSSGAVDGRVWDNVEALSETFQSGDIVHIKGMVQFFQGRKQVVIHRLEKALPEDYQLDDFIVKSARAPETMMAELMLIVGEVQNTHIRQLMLEVLNDPSIRQPLLLAPAAKTVHHAYQGGLLEHILSICGLMKLIATHYKTVGVELRLDELIFGAVFHDLGKIWEFEADQGIRYTDKGQLLGHIVMAVELVERKASRLLGFPEALKDRLKHIILSHHGKVEYGSPKLPMFLEAFIVAAIDDLDSKINSIDQFIKSERQVSEGWSRYHQLLGRSFLLKSDA